MKVLILDDSPLVLNRLAELVGEISNVTLIAQLAKTSHLPEAILDTKPDVLILDSQFIAGNGISRLKELQVDEAPIVKIVLTAFPNSLFRQSCFDIGADYFLDKAMEFEQITNILEDLVIQRSKNVKMHR